MRVLRKKDVARKVGLSGVHIMRLTKDGRFPAPFQLGPASIGWLENEIDQWIEEKAGMRQVTPLVQNEDGQ